MATYPVTSDQEYEVIDYPSNRQVKSLIRVYMKLSQMSKGDKEDLANAYGVDTDLISSDLTVPEFTREAADIVFKDEIPESLDADDISPRAVQEAISDFFGGGGGMRSGLTSF